MADYASEGGHFYDKDGSPKYTYTNKKGEEKPTTLREARKFGWLPSYSEIAKLAAKPGLDAWRIDQTILACLTMPRVEGEDEQTYIKRLKEDSKAQAKAAADKGTEIHGYIEKGFRGETFISADEYAYYHSVYNTITKECGVQEWHTEKSFASTLGYGGKVDLHNDLYLIDFKGTDKPMDSLKLWDEHYMQLAAYSVGILGSYEKKCGICYIHRETAESRLIWADKKDMEKGWRCFIALLDLWYAKTGIERIT